MLSDRWSVFSASPHRMLFWSGVSYSVLAILLWSFLQTSLFQPWLAPILWKLPYIQAHGFMMIYGVFGFYFFGFLLTTFPRWLDQPSVSKPAYVAVWACLFLGAHLFWVGLFAGKYFSLVGSVLMFCAYVIAIREATNILLSAKNASRYQQVVILLGLTVGAFGIALYGWGIATQNFVMLASVSTFGIYLFLLPVILAVLHRMVPFFTSTVTEGYQIRRWPMALWLYLVLLLVFAYLENSHKPEWTWVASLPIALVLTTELVMWKFWLADRRPLLFILYLGLGWIWFSFVLSGSESLYMLLADLPARPFGRAALHALLVGGFGSMLIGISTRVTLGHSGRGLATDRLTAFLFYGFQIVPLARVLPEIAGFWVPPLAVQGYWAGWLWAIVFGIWFVAFGPALTRPRSDGRPG